MSTWNEVICSGKEWSAKLGTNLAVATGNRLEHFSRLDSYSSAVCIWSLVPPRSFVLFSHSRDINGRCRIHKKMLKTQIFSLLFVLSPQCILSRRLVCFSPAGALPNPLHCRELIAALTYIARGPEGDRLLSWGRHLPESDETQNLPVRYYVQRREPQTCAVWVDVNHGDLFAIDRFKLSDVISVAQNIIVRCLIAENEIGM